MKIDTHQHYWRYWSRDFPWINATMPVLQRDCMPTDCVTDMHAAGIDGVIAVQARAHAEETDFLLRLARQNAKVLGVVGWADLHARDLDHRLEQWCAHAVFRGLRHLVQDEPDVVTWADAPATIRGMQILQRRALVFDVLVFDHQLADVSGFCKRHDQHWLVLDHVGKPALRDWSGNAERQARWRADLQVLADLPHVMCKLSGLVTEADWSAKRVLSFEDGLHILACFDQALESFGPERLMFGSDWPVCQLASAYSEVHGLASTWASSRLNAQEQHAFWASNAMHCYDLAAQAVSN